MEIARLEQWAELLTKYPIILDYMAVTNGTTPNIAILEDLRKTRAPTSVSDSTNSVPELIEETENIAIQ